MASGIVQKLRVERKLKQFFLQYPVITYKKHEQILRANDIPQGILYLSSGYVRMYQIFEGGKELTLHIFKPGTYFPMIWGISDIENTYYFEAFTSVVVHRAPKKEVVHFLKSDIEIFFDLTKRIVIGLNGLLSDIERLLSSNARERVALVLLTLGKRFGKQKQKNKLFIALNLSHEDIARLVCLTRETTSVEMKKLMDKKIIYYKRRYITIINIHMLQKLCCM